MGTVFRRDGEKRYSIAWIDEHGKRRSKRSSADRQVANRELVQLEDRATRLRLGMPVEGGGQSPVAFAEAHAGFVAELRRLGRSASHLWHAERDLGAMAQSCGWRALRDITAAGFREHLDALAADQYAPRTLNHKLDTACRFCRWCVDQGWLATNPLAKLRRVSIGTPGDVSRRPMSRRALSLDEFNRLTTCPEIQPWRRQLYLVAGTSGLRGNELRQITGEDFTLGARPRWHPRAVITKAKRADVVPMLPECAAALVELAAGKHPSATIFRGRPNAMTVRADFDRAKIPYRDTRGRMASFHSLRYFFCTVIGRSLPIQTVKQLMRHATIKLTIDLYTDLGLDDVAEQLTALPPLFAGKDKAERVG
jgi:integrase